MTTTGLLNRRFLSQIPTEATQQWGILEGLRRDLPNPAVLLRPLTDRKAIRSLPLEVTYAPAGAVVAVRFGVIVGQRHLSVSRMPRVLPLMETEE